MNFKDYTVDEALLFSFFAMYLYELEKDEVILSRIKNVTFHSHEANTDKDLKIVIKEYMENKPRISIKTNDSCFLTIDEQCIVSNVNRLYGFSINKVFLSDDLTDEHKKEIKESKSSVYTDPDVYIEVLDPHNVIQHISLELKSTKKNKIPGSSVQQANPYEWTLFVKHDSHSVELTSGLYANTVTGRLPFPDRSPRPEVSFNELKEWNEDHRTYDKRGFSLKINTTDLEQKALIILDWEQSLVINWLDYVKSDINSNKWFNHALRMFTVDLITHYDNLSDLEKKIFLDKNMKHL